MRACFNKPPLLPLALVTALLWPRVDAQGLRSCEQPANGVMPHQLPWLPNGATQNYCDQTRVHSASQMTNADDWPDKVTAFRRGELVGIRDKTAAGSKPLLFEGAAWDEAGFAGSPGELWWGRRGNTHVFTGQESFLRLATGNAFVLPAEAAQRAEYLRQQIAAMKNRQPPPPLPASAGDATALFGKALADFKQIGSTTATFEGGLGGHGDIPPGRISRAKLTLESSPALHGKLNFDLDVDGESRSFSLPVAHNAGANDARGWLAPEAKYRIRAVGGDERSGETYQAYGAFFGERGALAAVHLRLTVDSPRRNRSQSRVTAVVVLQSTDGPPANVVVQRP